jgi:hypothetical protein
MDQTTFVSTGLWWVLWLVGMGAVMRWIARSRGQAPAPGAETSVRRYPKVLVILGAVGLAFFVALAALSAIYRGKDDPAWLPALFLSFSLLLGAPLVLVYFRTRYELLPDGLRYQSLYRRQGSISWMDVTKVGCSHSAGWFSVSTRDGRVVRLSFMLTGLPQFARALLAANPATAVDASARPLLEQSAAGSPPHLW